MAIKKPTRRSSALKRIADESTHDTARLEALFASIGEGIIATDETGTITRINKKALHLLSMRERDVLGKPFLSAIVAVHDNGKPISAFDRPIVKAFQTGKSITSRTLYRKKDGVPLPISLTVSAIIYRGRPIGAIEVFRDLTDDIRSDKLKSEFISIASHQLRTPLSAVNMYAMMLRDGMAGSLTSDQQIYIETILTSARRMNVLIDTLLSITRLEAGSIELHMQSVHPNELTQEVLQEFIPTAHEKKLSLTIEVPRTMKSVYTDGLMVKEICANLLSNAVKYTPKGGAIRFALTETPTEVQWTVQDTGYGIPTSEQKNIFLKFFRAENIVDKDVSGTGLGLYLIKNIAERLGGDLWFESTENVGSIFHFSLPRSHGRPAAGEA